GDTAAHGEVGDAERLAGDDELAAGGQRSRSRGVGGDLDRALGADRELAEDLERRRIVGIADGAIGGDEALRDQPTAPRDRLGHAAGPAEVLHGAQAKRADDREAHGTNRTRSPRWSSGPSGPNIRIPAIEPIRCQPPGESNGYTAECRPAI